jgi:hypothetical protein
MSTPATDKITSTFQTPHIKSGFSYPTKFEGALKIIEAGLLAGKIWNQEFQDAKYYIAHACEHAQHISAEAARQRGRSYGDARDEIGYAFQMNQAAKVSRNLKKLAKRIPAVLKPGIADYILTLDQIDSMWKWLKSVKPIIVKGRKPNIENKTPEQIDAEMTNTGTCAICEKRQKLSGGEIRERNMVHHGYQMSDYNHSGVRMGKCFGAFKLPYEVSCVANKEFKTLLQQELKDLEAYLKALKAKQHDTLEVTEYPKGFRQPVQVPYKRGTEKYEQERASRVRRTEGDIRSTKDQIVHQTAKIEGWKPAPLYDETKKS